MSDPLRGRRNRNGLNAEINVTSLVDVAFTLLIIFIITAPMMQGGIEVDLPSAEAAALTTGDAVIVSIDRNGAIFVEDVPAASVEELRMVFPQVVQEKGVKTAALKADREVPHGLVVQVLGALKGLDVAEVGIIVDPELRD